MSDATDREAALKELMRLVQPDVEPRLSTSGSESELDLILDQHKRAKRFAAEALKYGDLILPTTRNGYRYMVTTAGTAGAEPTWPTSGSVTSGTATFTLWGPDYDNIYDVKAAAYECWALKASKASQFVQDGELRMDQIYQHCMERAAFYSQYVGRTNARMVRA